MTSNTDEFSYAILTFLRNNYNEAWIYKSFGTSTYLYGSKDNFTYALKVNDDKLISIEVTDVKLADIKFLGMNDYINALKTRLNALEEFKQSLFDFFKHYIPGAEDLEENEQYENNLKTLMLTRINENTYNDLKRSIIITDSNDQA